MSPHPRIVWERRVSDELVQSMAHVPCEVARVLGRLSHPTTHHSLISEPPLSVPDKIRCMLLTDQLRLIERL